MQAGRHDVHSPTGAQADVFEAREHDLDKLRAAFPPAAGQCGALLALPGGRLALDWVSRPDAFARLYGKLLDGYLLDALESLGGKPVRGEALEEFVAAVGSAPGEPRPSVGRGEDVRLRADRIVGSGLELDGELVQLCAFTSDATGARTSIARPSRRH